MAHPRYSSRNHFVAPPTVPERIFALVPSPLASLLRWIFLRVEHEVTNNEALRIPKTLREARRHKLNPFHLLNIPNAFILLWIFVLLWGERWEFGWSIDACRWSNWERWVSERDSRNLHITKYKLTMVSDSLKLQLPITWSSLPTLNSSIHIHTRIEHGCSRSSP
jgi:hypothetical protein